MRVLPRGRRPLTPIQLVDNRINLLEGRKAAVKMAETEERHARKAVEVIDGYYDDIWGFRYAPSRCFKPEIGLVVDVHGGGEEVRHQKWEEIREAQCRRLRAAITGRWQVRDRCGTALDLEYELAILYEQRRILVVELRARRAAQEKVQIDPSLILIHSYL